MEQQQSAGSVAAHVEQISVQQQRGLKVGKGDIVPLTKHLQCAILSSPAAVKTTIKSKGKEYLGSSSKGMTDSKRRSVRLANKPKCNLSMEAQATQLLMKKSGLLEAQQDDTDKFAH